jgi:hypothetical protein
LRSLDSAAVIVLLPLPAVAHIVRLIVVFPSCFVKERCQISAVDRADSALLDGRGLVAPRSGAEIVGLGAPTRRN